MFIGYVKIHGLRPSALKGHSKFEILLLKICSLKPKKTSKILSATIENNPWFL